MKKGKARNNGLLPNSLRIISSCLKTVSTNASSVASTVRSAGVSVAASISAASEDHKDQVTWAGFDRLELSLSAFKHVLLLGYLNGFQVVDVDDASNFSELVSKRDGPVTFLQMQPIPLQSDGQEGFRTSHPLLLVVAGEESNCLNPGQNLSHFSRLGRDGISDAQSGNCVSSPTTVRFYSLRSNCYVHVLRFRSAVRMVRCSARIVAVGLATQIYCFDALTLGNKFSVLTYPVPQLGGQGTLGVNVGYGPMAVGPRWLAYASNNPLLSNRGRMNPQNVTPSPGVSPSTSPGGSSLVARYAMESSKQLAAGIINLGDIGYKTLSKYCQDLIPDGSNSPGWKVGGLAAAEADNAGMVVIKDYVSRAVISQFRAHTSPISALCFDPSGTLLVTVSVHGNNINMFRIMPSRTYSGSGCQNHDWSSSHVHLYKLHRGMTTAIIQDISFSHYSQWISIVSSKGTCHVFVISPFGGDSGFQTSNSHGEEPSLFPVLSLPWWFSSSCIINQQSFPAPPPPHTLSVVSRIKNCHSGLLNTVSNAAASATGKVLVPSGAVAAVFHNSLSQSPQHVHTRVNSLEHLLVYTPSGHVIQHELIPSVGVEHWDGTRTLSGSFGQMQEEELRVRVEPIQWWDVCRRSEWPEREERLSERQKHAKIIVDKSKREDSNRTDILDIKSESMKPLEKSHWYLSNAEVQISSGMVPIWHKSKISFYMMDPPRVNNHVGGEFEIEKLPVHEVEIRRKDLLPVFDHFHSIKSGWNDRSLAGGSYPNALSLESHQAKDRVTEETVICHSKPASLSSTESSDGGSSRRIENLLDLDQMSSEKSYIHTCRIPNEFYQERRENAINDPSLIQKSSTIVSSSFEHLNKIDARVDNHITDVITSDSNLPSVGRAADEGACSLNTRETSDVTMQSPNCYDLAMDIPKDVSTPSNVLNPIDFSQFLQEGYHKTLEHGGCRELAEVVTDDLNSSGSQHERENPDDDDEENEEMLGGIFAFSEEG